MLGGPDDQRAVENELVLSLGFEHFELIKELIKNRCVRACRHTGWMCWSRGGLRKAARLTAWLRMRRTTHRRLLLQPLRLKIVWCTKLSRAETEEERERIETEMSGAPDTAAILAALRATRTSARDRQTAMERSIREEARRLKQGEAGEWRVCACGGGGGGQVDWVGAGWVGLGLVEVGWGSLKCKRCGGLAAYCMCAWEGSGMAFLLHQACEYSHSHLWSTVRQVPAARRAPAPPRLATRWLWTAWRSGRAATS